MTPQDFELALQRTHLDGGSRATKGARLAFLLGLSPARAARAVGCSRQAVEAAKRRIIDSLEFCPTCGRARDDSDTNALRGRASRPLGC